MKNPTPRQIVLISSVIIFSCLLVIEILGYFIPSLQFPEFDLFIIPFFILLITFGVFYYAVENFIYRKIKLIYKKISDPKSTKHITDQRVNMTGDIITEVQDEVVRWAREKGSQIDQLKKQADYRKEFLGNVSHELKTPIFNIQGYLETLADGGLNDPRINLEYLGKALQNVERLASIVNDLESISHLESGELVIHYARFDVCAMTKKILDELEIQAKNKGIALRIKDGCDAEFNVRADPKLIHEVLINLITNSIRYGKESGRTQIGFYNMGDNVLIEVSDDGIGIARDHFPRLFERFYRVEKSRSRLEGGTGLGLAIVKHIIEAHDQTINVRSTLGEGSTFGFTLPKN